MGNKVNEDPKVYIIDDIVSAYHAQQNDGGSGTGTDESGNVVTITAEQKRQSGTELGSITIGNSKTTFYAPPVSAQANLNSGMTIGSITIDGVTTTFKAPADAGGSGGGSGGDTVIVQDAYELAEIVDFTTNQTVSTVYIDCDENSHAFSLGHEFYFEVLCKGVTGSASKTVSISACGTDSASTYQTLIGSISIPNGADARLIVYGKNIPGTKQWMCWARTSYNNGGSDTWRANAWHDAETPGEEITKFKFIITGSGIGNESNFKLYGVNSAT